jgi:tripartite-type tricarboxylate transporter receptor subunit TctC
LNICVTGRTQRYACRARREIARAGHHLDQALSPPDLPTPAESGFPGFEAVPRFGLLAPAGTPKDVLDKLQSEPVKALAMPEVRKKFDELGIDPFGNPYEICDASNHTPTPSRQTVASTG